MLLVSKITDGKSIYDAFVGYYADKYVKMTKIGGQMDDVDKNIVALLSQDARMSLAVLARRLKIARSTVQMRLEKLETSGAIAGYTLRLGDQARGSRITATALLVIEPRSQPAILIRLRQMPQVERIHTTSGRIDMLVQLVTSSTAELDITLERIGEIEGVRSSESLIHLATKLDRSL